MILDNNWLVYHVYQFINSFSFYRVMTCIDAENVKFWLCSFVSSQNMIFFSPWISFFFFFFFLSFLGFHLSEEEKDGKNYEGKVGEHDLKEIKIN